MLINAIVWIINKSIAMLGSIAKMVLGLLPDSPFQAITVVSDVAPMLGSLNWIVPVGEILAILQAWVLAIGIFYIYQVILRWVKVVG